MSGRRPRRTSHRGADAGGARPPRGFTLVELMIAVGIVGLLASVAVPLLTRATLRSRAAERLTIMRAIADAVNDTISIQQRIPGGSWPGVPNPATVPGTTKRTFDWAAAGWPPLSMVVIGDTYYQYSFLATEDEATRSVALRVSAVGDLDGDSVPSMKHMYFKGVGYSLQPDPVTPEDPPRGQEDRTTF